MKRFLILLFVVFGFSVLATAQDLTRSAIERRYDRNNDRIENPRHKENPKTWVDRGVIYQDMFDLHIEYLYFGMGVEELTLFMGEPEEIRTVETEFATREIRVYENVEVHFQRGALVGYKKYETMHDNPLDEAYDAYQTAIRLEEEQELSFFQSLFRGSQDRRLRDNFVRLFGQYINVAVLNYENNVYDKSFDAFRKAINVADSEYFDEELEDGIVFNAGFVATLAGKSEVGLEYFNRAREMGYDYPNLYSLIASSYMELGDTLSAEAALQDGFERYPEDNAILIELVNFYIANERTEDALEFLRLAKEQEPDNPTFHYAEGTLLEGMGQQDDARSAYKNALEINPDYFEANFNIGIMTYNDAVDIMAEAQELTDNIEYVQEMERAAETIKEALPYMERAHKVNPEDIDTMETLRILYYRLNMEEELKEMYEKLGREFDLNNN